MKYLITGGSGFLGTRLIERLIAEGHKVKTIARNEGKLIDLKNRFGVEIAFGDIANRFICEQFFEESDGVFHLAAFKHVTLAEKFAFECINSNVIGSENVLEFGTKVKPKFIIGISTDKASQVAGVYGATKLLMEKMFTQYEKIHPEINYRIVRYGNILYSTGSVLCKWKESLLTGEDITVTCRDATRFFWTIDQAVDLIFDCLDKAENSAPFVPEMKSIRVGDLLDAMLLKYRPYNQIKVHEIGLQPGENLHEKILEYGPYSNEVEQYSKEEILTMI